MPLTYATVAQFKANPDTPSHLSDDLVAARLAEAEKDIDSIFAGRGIVPATGRRWNVDGLPPYQLEALVDATVQQAMFRIDQGAAYFAGVAETIQGPDYTVTREAGRQVLSPAALGTLRLAGLIPRGGRARA